MTPPKETSLLEKTAQARKGAAGARLGVDKQLEKTSRSGPPNTLESNPESLPTPYDGNPTQAGSGPYYAGFGGGISVIGATVDVNGAPLNANAVFSSSVVSTGVNRSLVLGEHRINTSSFAYVAAGTNLRFGKPADGTVKVEQTKHYKFGASGTAMVPTMLGIGGSLALNGASEMSFEHSMPVDQAESLRRQLEDGPLAGTRRKAIAIGLLNSPLPWPDLREPAQLHEGDRVRCTVTGILNGRTESSLGELAGRLANGFQARAVLATPIATFKINAGRTTEYALLVERTGANSITVHASPKSNVSVGGSFDVPLVAEGQSSVATDSALKFGYTFDLNSISGVTAYRQLLDGTLPETYDTLSALRSGDVSALTQFSKEQNLLSGVTRLYAEYSETPLHKSRSAALYLSKPYRGAGGVSWSRELLTGKRTRVTGQVVEVDQWRSITNHTDRSVAGAAVETLIAASTDRLDSNVEKVTANVLLGASFGTDATHGAAPWEIGTWLNRNVLVDHLAPDQTWSSRYGHDYAYRFNLSRSITVEEWQRAIEHLDASPQNLQPALKSLLTRVKDLGDSADSTALLNALDIYLKADGKKGIGRLHRLLGDDSALHVTVEIPMLQDVHAQTNRLLTAYHAEVSSTDTQSAVEQRLFDVSAALSANARALDRVQRDSTFGAFDPSGQADAVAALRENMRLLAERADFIYPQLSPEAQKVAASMIRARDDATLVQKLLSRQHPFTR